METSHREFRPCAASLVLSHFLRDSLVGRLDIVVATFPIWSRSCFQVISLYLYLPTHSFLLSGQYYVVHE